MTEVIARLRHGSKDFEILVDQDKAMDLRHGKSIDVREIIAIEAVYTDAKKGLHASESDLKQVFKTTSVFEVAEQIIKRGNVQITTEYKKKLRDAKIKQIVDFISKNAINPQTNLPHPPQRISSALAESGTKIDEFKNASEQISDVLRDIQKILPIRIEVKKLAVKIPAIYTGKAYSITKEYSKQEEWQSNGDLICVLEIPAGIQIEFFNKLNSVTQGNAEVREVKQ